MSEGRGEFFGAPGFTPRTRAETIREDQYRRMLEELRANIGRDPEFGTIPLTPEQQAATREFQAPSRAPTLEEQIADLRRGAEIDPRIAGQEYTRGIQNISGTLEEGLPLLRGAPGAAPQVTAPSPGAGAVQALPGQAAGIPAAVGAPAAGVDPGRDEARSAAMQSELDQRGAFRAGQDLKEQEIPLDQEEASDFEEMNAFYEEEDRLDKAIADAEKKKKAGDGFLSTRERKIARGLGFTNMGLGLGQLSDAVNSLDPQESLGAMTTFLGGYLQLSTAAGRGGKTWNKWGPAISMIGSLVNIYGRQRSGQRQADYQSNLTNEVSTALVNSGRF